MQHLPRAICILSVIKSRGLETLSAKASSISSIFLIKVHIKINKYCETGDYIREISQLKKHDYAQGAEKQLHNSFWSISSSE